MSDLITIERREVSGATVQTCNARDLWQFVESKKQFADWIKDRIERYRLVEDEDFTVHKFVNGRATVIDYHLTIDTAKELAMVENNDKGREVRRYFIACERKAKEAPAVDPLVALNDPAIMRGMLLTYSEKVLTLETKVSELAPKAAALDIISTADGSVCISTAAKLWQVRPKDAFLWLSCNRYIFRRHSSGVWIGYQDKIQQGLLEMKTDTVERSDGTKKTVESVLVTPKGLAKLAVLIGGKEAA